MERITATFRSDTATLTLARVPAPTGPARVAVKVVDEDGKTNEETFEVGADRDKRWSDAMKVASWVYGNRKGRPNCTTSEVAWIRDEMATYAGL
jgi:hypothetical protein